MFCNISGALPLLCVGLIFYARTNGFLFWRSYLLRVFYCEGSVTNELETITREIEWCTRDF